MKLQMTNDLEKRKQKFNDCLEMLTNDNKQFVVTAYYLLDLVQRAGQLFKKSDNGLRQKLLKYLLSSIELNDKKLFYEINDSFKTIVETKKKAFLGSNSDVWCE